MDGYVPHLILLDLEMPEIDGWDTLIRIHNLSKLHQAKIAIYSASEAQEDKTKAKELGAVEFIHKPAKKDELLEKVENLLK
jgi:CheY-like chemotaxis protein